MMVITMAKLCMAHASRLGQYAWCTQARMAHVSRLGQKCWSKIKNVGPEKKFGLQKILVRKKKVGPKNVIPDR